MCVSSHLTVVQSNLFQELNIFVAHKLVQAHLPEFHSIYRGYGTTRVWLFTQFYMNDSY